MGNNIETRVTKLEGSIGINKKAETLEDMIEAFGAGKYGQATVASIVAGAMSAEDRGEFFLSLRQQYPDPLVDFFVEAIMNKTTGNESK